MHIHILRAHFYSLNKLSLEISVQQQHMKLSIYVFLILKLVNTEIKAA